MPISKKEFKKGHPVTDAEKTMLNFLKRNPDKAYAARELVEALGYVLGEDLLGDFVTMTAVNEILKTLIKEKAVVKRHIGFTDYYMVKS
ncbi:MAG: hypothetical protein E3J35_00385 [Methanomassiliicoccales archaeon]|nr:MAG: hypothetical protein E3J35_00385 [Methanomassiliicoccales archaeon]